MFRIALVLTGLLVASSLQASDKNLEKVGQTLQSLYPATTFTEVRPSPVKGVYEVIMGKNVAYTDETGRYFMFGHMLDMSSQQDLTAELLETLNKIDISTLPIEDSIKIVHGNGDRKLYLFSDPDCPYCKRLEKELQKLDNVTIYTFLYPIDELHPQAADKSRLVWCAKDQEAAWKALMQQGTPPANSEEGCQNPIERNVRLAKQLGIEGTPTMILENGKFAQGYMEISELGTLLEGEKQ